MLNFQLNSQHRRTPGHRDCQGVLNRRTRAGHGRTNLHHFSREVDRLFEIVERLKREGVAILFIRHFIEEILGLGDEMTMLRSGKHVITAPTES